MNAFSTKNLNRSNQKLYKNGCSGIKNLSKGKKKGQNDIINGVKRIFLGRKNLAASLFDKGKKLNSNGWGMGKNYTTSRYISLKVTKDYWTGRRGAPL